MFLLENFMHGNKKVNTLFFSFCLYIFICKIRWNWNKALKFIGHNFKLPFSPLQRLGMSTLKTIVFMNYFQAWLNNAIAYIEVDELYTFEANATRGTNMTISWSLEPTVNTTDFIMGELSSKSLDHSFSSPGTYEIVISVANLVSTDSETFTIYVLYSVDCLSFSVDNGLANTTLAAIFSFNLPAACRFPMGNVDFFTNFNHSVPLCFMESLTTTLPLPYTIEKSHLFDTQGFYEVYATAENILGHKQFSLVLEVWDTLIPLGLEIKNSIRGNIFATNTTTTLEFVDVPNAGSEYVINYGDGWNHSSNSSDILYEPYSLSPFEHVYTEPEVYTVVWKAENGHDPYDRQDSFTIIVQNEVKDFKVVYIEVRNLHRGAVTIIKTTSRLNVIMFRKIKFGMF